MTSDGIGITHVTLDQLSEVEAVMARAFEPRFGEAWSPAQCLAVLTLPGYALRIASRAGRVVGFSMARQVAGESELLLLAVDPSARGAGVGAALVADWLDWAARDGAVRFFLEMRVDNPARRLYDQFNFTECGIRPAYYRGRDDVFRDAVTMQRISVSQRA